MSELGIAVLTGLLRGYGPYSEAPSDPQEWVEPLHELSRLGASTLDFSEFWGPLTALSDQQLSQLRVTMEDLGLAVAVPPVWIPVINKCMESGVPVILVDSNLPDAKKIGFVGSDWTVVGTTLGQQVKKVADCKTIGVLGNIALSLQEQAATALKAELADTGINVIVQNDDGSVLKASSLARSLISAHPDLCGLVGLDNNAPDGIQSTINETKKAGKVHVWSIESTNPQALSWVQKGIIDSFVVQHPVLWGYYGMQMLYNWNHADLHILGSVDKNLMSVNPPTVDTGLTIVDKSNVDGIATASKEG